MKRDTGGGVVRGSGPAAPRAPRRIRARHLVGCAAAVVLLAGCGDRSIVVNVDVLSYLDESYTNTALGPVPPFPEGFYSGELPVVGDVQVNLAEGLDRLSTVRSVALRMSIVTSATSGSGSDTLRLYLSDLSTDPLETPAVLSMGTALAAGVSDTTEAVVDADSRILDLFTQGRMRLTLTSALRGPQWGGDVLNGQLTISAIDAVVIAGRKQPQ